jgi:hypothetical protein
VIKHRPSPKKIERRQEQFDVLLATMGIDSMNPFSRLALTEGLEKIGREYDRRAVQLNKPPDRKLVRRYRAAAAKHLSLSKKVGSDFLAEIEEAGWSQQNPGVNAGTLYESFTEYMAEHGYKRSDLIDVLTKHVLNIDYWLKTTGETYKQRYVTKLVVEPFLALIAEHGITTSSKDLPLYPMAKALFDWLEIEKASRLSGAAISGIARSLSSGSASKSNAKRRTKN